MVWTLLSNLVKKSDKVAFVRPIKKQFRLKYVHAKKIHSKYTKSKWKYTDNVWIIEQKNFFWRWERCSHVEFYNKRDAMNHFKKHFMEHFIYS
jgi:hypothetical protein